MKKTVCDYCNRQFSERDAYVNASVSLRYTYYAGDDGSEFIDQTNDMCEECLGKMIESLRALKKGDKK